MKQYNIIVAGCNVPNVNNNNVLGIGNNNTLPWPKYKSDMNYFRKMTNSTENINKKNAIIMGYNTWKSIPFKPLKGRLNVILTSTPSKIEEIQNCNLDDVKVFSSLESSCNYLNEQSNIETVFIIGGSILYNYALKNIKISNIFLTKIDKSFECDTFFDFNRDEYIMSNEIIITENDTTLKIQQFVPIIKN